MYLSVRKRAIRNWLTIGEVNQKDAKIEEDLGKGRMNI
jgi:hypothetical protein